MKYSKTKLNNPFVHDLQLEYIFLSEFMPDAPGDYVKIYLYGRMISENQGSLPEKDMAMQLGVSEEKIQEAWEYWENWGAVKRVYLDEARTLLAGIEFLNLKEQMFDPGEIPEEEGEEIAVFDDGGVPTFGYEEAPQEKEALK